jgi:hypothetical protein
LKSFSTFFSGGGYSLPAVTISKEQIDLKNPATRNEINRNLSAKLSIGFSNPYGGWFKSGRILELYGIALPKVIFNDTEEGEEIVAIAQFSKWGADLSGMVTSPNIHYEEEEYYFYYSYEVGIDGFYRAFAVITDETGLNNFISDELEDSESEFD